MFGPNFRRNMKNKKKISLLNKMLIVDTLETSRYQDIPYIVYEN